jgi:hypothetical protein
MILNEVRDRAVCPPDMDVLVRPDAVTGWRVDSVATGETAHADCAHEIRRACQRLRRIYALTQKERKTARELADMIARRLNIGRCFVTVHKDAAHGWHPTVMAAPFSAVQSRETAEKLAADLWEKFDLK